MLLILALKQLIVRYRLKLNFNCCLNWNWKRCLSSVMELLTTLKYHRIVVIIKLLIIYLSPQFSTFELATAVDHLILFHLRSVVACVKVDKLFISCI